MKPYYDHAGITIYLGDCREILPTLGQVDLMLTDPPYNAINRTTGGLRLFDKGTADSAPVDIGWLSAEFVRLATGSIYVWCSDEQYTGWVMAFKDAGYATRKCAWHKTNPSPMNGDVTWLSALELCVYARQPKAYHAPFCGHPIWTGPSEPRDDHPTPKPEWLMMKLIEASCPARGSVLDPFFGSGTTLYAAKQLNRKAIGIEIAEKYCESAALRLSQEVLAL